MSREYVLKESDFLVSQTDLEGMILFANGDFCTRTGYTLDELIGKPHNIVRHPEMPEAVFSDLWDTLKSAQPWKGYLKNRTKDGGYYWAYAMVYPMENTNGEKSGYISCRKKPKPEEIKAAMQLYRM